jgi:hypothetical protein
MTAHSLDSVRPSGGRAAAAEYARIGRIHWLLTIQTVVIVLLTVNRLTTLTTGYVAANQFLRWVDLHNMLTLPAISLCAFYLLKRTLEAARPVAGEPAGLGLTFLLGAYLYGAGYGAHEVTNYLHLRFCAGAAEPAGDLCRIVVFNDDSFSHWVWFAGFILINVSLLLLQAKSPLAGRLGGRDLALLVVNGLFIGAGIFANLAFEEIGIDLYVVAVVALLAIYLLWRHGRWPLFVYYTTAYGVGLLATALVKLLA